MWAAVLLGAGVLLNSVTASMFDPVHRSLHLRQDDGDGGDDGDDGNNYLEEMCYPDYANSDSEDGSVTTPCEAFNIIDSQCEANGSTTLDYLAQQECICGSGSGYFDMFFGCNSCMRVHGGVENEDYYPTAVISSASAAFCTGTPTTDFDDLIFAGISTASFVTGTDSFPSITAVSDYFTGTLETKAGQITGSATLATYNSDASAVGTGDGGNAFPSLTTGLASGETGVSITTSKGTASKSASTSTSTGAGGSSSTSASASGASASATGNAAADSKAMSGMLTLVAAGVGLICVV